MTLRLTICLTAIVMATAATSAKGPRVSPAEHLPPVSAVQQGYADIDSLRQAMSMRPLHRVEGLWRFPSDGGIVAVERCSLGGTASGSEADTYQMVIVSSANRILRPGTVMGYLWDTSQRNTYEARLYTSVTQQGATLTDPATFTLTLLDEDSRLSFRRHRKGVRINLWRLLPYMFRHPITIIDDTPRDLDGCVRLFPAPSIPSEPRYL